MVLCKMKSKRTRTNEEKGNANGILSVFPHSRWIIGQVQEKANVFHASILLKVLLEEPGSLHVYLHGHTHMETHTHDNDGKQSKTKPSFYQSFQEAFFAQNNQLDPTNNPSLPAQWYKQHTRTRKSTNSPHTKKD